MAEFKKQMKIVKQCVTCNRTSLGHLKSLRNIALRDVLFNIYFKVLDYNVFDLIENNYYICQSCIVILEKVSNMKKVLKNNVSNTCTCNEDVKPTKSFITHSISPAAQTLMETISLASKSLLSISTERKRVKKETKGIAPISSVKETESIAPISSGKETESIAPISSGKETENIAQISSVKETESIVPISSVKETESSVPILSDKETESTASFSSVNETESIAPISSDKETEYIAPISSDKETESIVPISSDKETKSSVSISSDKETESIAPISSDKETDSSVPISSDKETESTAPISSVKETESIAPISSDKETESNAPISSVKETESTASFSSVNETESIAPILSGKETDNIASFSPEHSYTTKPISVYQLHKQNIISMKNITEEDRLKLLRLLSEITQKKASLESVLDRLINIPSVFERIWQNILFKVASSVDQVCSTNKPSILRTKISTLNFSTFLSDVILEMHHRCPKVFDIFLMVLNPIHINKPECSEVIATIYAICLYTRNNQLGTFQKMVSALCKQYKAGNELVQLLHTVGITIPERRKHPMLNKTVSVKGQEVASEVERTKKKKVVKKMATGNSPKLSKSRKRKSQLAESSSSKSKKSTPDISPDTACDGNTSYTTVNPSSYSLNFDNDKRLDFSFYDVPCEDLAKALLGQTIVRICDGKRLSGMIVETEAYIGPFDKAAHSYKGKQTDKNTALFMPPGTAYVYNSYGIYCCLKISSKGDGAAVLIRALQPLDNLETMNEFRTNGKEGKSFLKKQGVGLCNGPSKLCQSLNIKKDSINKVDLCTSDEVWLEKNETISEDNIVTCKRINIGNADDWVDKPLRYYILGNNCVSVRDKPAEDELSKKTYILDIGSFCNFKIEFV